MGRIINTTLIITGVSKEDESLSDTWIDIHKVRALAVEIFHQPYQHQVDEAKRLGVKVTGMTECISQIFPMANFENQFVIVSTGSKIGHRLSDEWDGRLEEFERRLNLMRQDRYSGVSVLKVVHGETTPRVESCTFKVSQ